MPIVLVLAASSNDPRSWNMDWGEHGVAFLKRKLSISCSHLLLIKHHVMGSLFLKMQKRKRENNIVYVFFVENATSFILENLSTEDGALVAVVVHHWKVTKREHHE